VEAWLLCPASPLPLAVEQRPAQVTAEVRSGSASLYLKPHSKGDESIAFRIVEVGRKITADFVGSAHGHFAERAIVGSGNGLCGNRAQRDHSAGAPEVSDEDSEGEDAEVGGDAGKAEVKQPGGNGVSPIRRTKSTGAGRGRVEAASIRIYIRSGGEKADACQQSRFPVCMYGDGGT
jgi:hypothetical protein